MSTPNLPLPPPSPEPEIAEVPTAEAELQILLFPTSMENGTSHPEGPTGSTGQITQFAAVVILMTSTLFGARLAHLSPAVTIVAALVELAAALGLAHFRTISRRK